jgi:hypothetical protein
MPTTIITAMGPIDGPLPPPADPGPAVAVPGCRLIPQCGQVSWFGSTVFEQAGQVFMGKAALKLRTDTLPS